MKITDVKEIAAQRGVKPGRASKAELIRTLQAAEGNDACYATGKAEQCGQMECLWREDCDELQQKRKSR